MTIIEVWARLEDRRKRVGLARYSLVLAHGYLSAVHQHPVVYNPRRLKAFEHEWDI